MRPSVIVGVILIALGAFGLVRGGFTTQKDVVKVGDVKVTAPETQTIPSWASILAIVLGVGVIAVGARSKA